jgi:hypothetical protein
MSSISSHPPTQTTPLPGRLAVIGVDASAPPEPEVVAAIAVAVACLRRRAGIGDDLPSGRSAWWRAGLEAATGTGDGIGAHVDGGEPE